jgi:hypothetical protein
MITRAQAEALLTLAESLEACERLGLTMEVSPGGHRIVFRHIGGGFAMDLGRYGLVMSGVLRRRIADLIPKPGTYTLNWEERP